LQKADFLAQNAPKSFVARLSPDPLGELTALPLAAFDGPTSKRGEGRVGRCYAPVATPPVA